MLKDVLCRLWPSLPVQLLVLCSAYKDNQLSDVPLNLPLAAEKPVVLLWTRPKDCGKEGSLPWQYGEDLASSHSEGELVGLPEAGRHTAGEKGIRYNPAKKTQVPKFRLSRQTEHLSSSEAIRPPPFTVSRAVKQVGFTGG